MLKRLKIELDFEKIIDNVLEETIKKGLDEDRDWVMPEFGKKTFKVMQNEYRLYGSLFGLNFKTNLEKEFEKFINNIEED